MGRVKARKPHTSLDVKERPVVDTLPMAVSRAQYLTPNQVADRLLVATVTVRLWANKGLLPSVTTLGGHRRFRLEDVEAFAAKHQQVKASYRKPSPKVLIIDDDPQFSRYLSQVIATRASVVVHVANDGFSAGIKCESIRPDIVTLDLQMPDMDGFEVCALLRTMFGKTKLKIVALSAYASAANARRIITAGADACVAKTAPIEVLLGEMGLTHVLRL